ncbi:glutamate 5-kinase [Spirochaetota bacterium]
MRNFTNIKRIVIKIGTKTLSKGSKVDTVYLRSLAREVKKIISQGKQVIIVSSGAIGMGAGSLGLKENVKDIKKRQACAAIGQPLLMHEYQRAFSSVKVKIAQVLLTSETFNHRKSYLALQNSIDTLLNLKIVPILNENDSVSTEEIGSAFGDNDTLSALVASKIDADLLIMLSDIDSLYTRDPKKYKTAKPINTVFKITDKIMKSAGGSGSKFARGGMKTKLNAARIVFNSGCRLIITNGRIKNVLTHIMSGEDIGTLFMPKQKLSNRERWILNSNPCGTITVDKGAIEALKNSKSLLPVGIKSFKGTFKAGSVILINDVAKAVTSLSSEELNLVIGKHSTEIRKKIGKERPDVVATPENIIFVE